MSSQGILPLDSRCGRDRASASPGTNSWLFRGRTVRYGLIWLMTLGIVGARLVGIPIASIDHRAGAG